MTDKEIRNTLIELLQKYPDASIRVVVDEEVVTGEYSTYMVDIFSIYYNTFVFYNDKYYDDVGELYDDWEYYTFGDSDIPENEKKLKFEEEFDNKWEEAIFIHATA